MTQSIDRGRYEDPITLHFDLMGLIGSGMADELLVIASGVFLAGTFIAFISPTGGFLQVVGLIAFLGKVVPELASDAGIGLGVIFGIASTILVLYSLSNPVGVGIPHAHRGLSGNYLNVVTRNKKFNVNALCIIGGGLAVIALFMPWVSTTLVTVSESQTFVYPATPVDYVSSHMNYQGVGTSTLSAAISVLFAGVVLTFVTPLAGFLQAAGIGLFYANIESYLMTSLNVPAYSFFETELVYGLAVGTVAAGITILSFFVNLGRPTTKNLLSCDRILTWTMPVRDPDPQTM